MSRLASFKGPSTPSSSPVRAPERPSSSPSHSFEPTYHRKTRHLLNEFRVAASNWDDLLSDGQGLLEKLINIRTELEQVFFAHLFSYFPNDVILLNGLLEMR